MLQENLDRLASGANCFAIKLEEKQLSSFELFEHELSEWNKVMNLTSIKEEQEVVDKHFIDSLSILKFVDIQPDSKLIDVGTGAGFPGIPLKIVRNDIDTTFLDSTGKKLNFISNVMTKLDAKSWSTVHSRAEEAGHSALREQFDFATARAVAELRVLAEYCLPLLKIGGVFIAMKSVDCESEISEARKVIALLGGEVESVNNFILPGTELSRSIVVIKKIMNTPARFPRPVNKISKEVI